MSASHSWCSLSCRTERPSRNFSASSRVDSSRATTESPDAATTDRRSRRSSSSRSAKAASARSSHSATRSRGSRSSASDTTPSDLMGGWPSAFSFSFCSFSASRTAGTPPRRTCSATARCSSGRVSRIALRCVRPGFSRLGLGRSGSMGTGGRGALAAFLGLALLARRPRCPIGGGGIAVALGGAVAALASVAALTVATRRAVAALAPRAIPLVDQCGGDRLERPLRADDLEQLRLLAGALGRQDRQDGDAVDVHVGVDPQHVADLRCAREDRALDNALGLAGAGCPPGPRAVGARAGQLDLDPAGHG